MRHPYLSDDPKRSDGMRSDGDRSLVSPKVLRVSESFEGREIDQGSDKDVVKPGSAHQKEFSPSDAELVTRVQNGSKEDFQILVERYQQRAFAVAFQILKRYDDAQDVVQESFVKAYLSIDSFHGTSSFFTWFYRIVVNMAIDFRRKAGRKEKETISLDVEERDAIEQHVAGSLVSQPDNPLEVTLRGEQARQINQVLGEISEDHRAVIVLREVEGLRYEQIADVLGISKGTVMSRLHYARKRLQQLLTGMWGNEAGNRVRG